MSSRSNSQNSQHRFLPFRTLVLERRFVHDSTRLNPWQDGLLHALRITSPAALDRGGPVEGRWWKSGMHVEGSLGSLARAAFVGNWASVDYGTCNWPVIWSCVEPRRNVWPLTAEFCTAATNTWHTVWIFTRLHNAKIQNSRLGLSQNPLREKFSNIGQLLSLAPLGHVDFHAPGTCLLVGILHGILVRFATLHVALLAGYVTATVTMVTVGT